MNCIDAQARVIREQLIFRYTGRELVQNQFYRYAGPFNDRFSHHYLCIYFDKGR